MCLGCVLLNYQIHEVTTDFYNRGKNHEKDNTCAKHVK